MLTIVIIPVFSPDAVTRTVKGNVRPVLDVVEIVTVITSRR